MAKQDHLTTKGGGSSTGKVGKMSQPGPHDKTKDLSNEMGTVKKVAGGSNYPGGGKDYPLAKRRP